MLYEKPNKDGKIFLGVDATGKQIWTTEEEEERKAMKRQAWQRSMFAKELGFDPNTKDKAELAAIDEKYEAMRQEVNEWNENQQRIMDRWVLAERKWMAGMISEEEYENIVHPDKRAIVRFPEDMGGHGDNFSLFYCTECKNEFCMINEKGVAARDNNR